MKKFLLILLLLPTLVFGQLGGPTASDVSDGEGAATLVWLGTPSNSSESIANIRPGDTIVMGIKIHNYKNNNAITYAHIDVQYDKRMYTKINHVFSSSADGTSHFIGDNFKMNWTDSYEHYDIWSQWSRGGGYQSNSNYWIDHYQANGANNLASLDWYVKVNLLVKDYDANLDYTDGIIVTMGRMTESNGTVYDPMYAYEYQDFTYVPVQAAPTFSSAVEDGQDAVIYKSFKINQTANNNNQSEYNAHPANENDFNDMFDYANKKTTEWTHYGRETATKAFTWPWSDILPRHDNSNFGWEIEAKFVPEETGTYTFELDSDDRSDLFFDTNGDGNMTNTNLDYNNGKRTVDISLTADNVYSFRVRYEQGAGGADLYLKWKRPSDSDYQFNKDEIWSVSPASIPHKLDVVYNINDDLDKTKFTSKLEYDNGTVNGTKTESLGTNGQVSYNDDGGGVYSTQVNTGNKKATTTGGSVEWCVIYAYDNTNNRYRVGIDSREFTNQQPDWDKVTKLKLFDLWDGSVTPKSGNNNSDTHWNEYWIYTDTELDFSNSTFSSYIRSMNGGGYGIKAEFEFVDVTSYINHDLLLEVDNTYYSDQYANVVTVQDLVLAFNHLTAPGSGGPFGGSGGIYTTGIEYVLSDVNEDDKFDFTDTQLMMQHIYGDTDPFENNTFDDVVLLFESDYNSWSTSDWSTSVPRGKTKTYVPSTSFSQRTQSNTYNIAFLGDVNFSHSEQPTNYTTNSAQQSGMSARYSSTLGSRTSSDMGMSIEKIGDVLSVVLDIPSNNHDITGTQFKMYFDNGRIEFVDSEISDSQIDSFTTARTDYVTIGSFSSDGSQNINGGIQYKLNFKIKSNLSSTLGLLGLKFYELVDSDGKKINMKIK
jgi:hypothetical protein